MNSIPLYGGLHSQFVANGLTGVNSGPVISPLVTSRSQNTPLFSSLIDSSVGPTGITGPQGPVGIDLFQPGMIMMFNSASPPAGWLLCDGTNSTPNLTGQFVRQQDVPNGLIFGANGGNANITLSLLQMPSHTHSVDTHNGVGTSLGAGDSGSPTGQSQISTSVGGGTAFSILPPYYVLTFIMKS